MGRERSHLSRHEASCSQEDYGLPDVEIACSISAARDSRLAALRNLVAPTFSRPSTPCIVGMKEPKHVLLSRLMTTASSPGGPVPT